MSQDFEFLFKYSVYDKTLKSEHVDLLNYLLTFPNITAYSYYKVIENGYINNKKPHYITVNRLFKYLFKLHLIKISKEKYIVLEKNKGKDKKPYRLSINGIFYKILMIPNDYHYKIVNLLLKNYDSNILFTTFLYPIVDKNTILKIDNVNILNIIYTYLKDVCKAIFESIKTDNTQLYDVDEDGNILNRIFLWPQSVQPSQSSRFYDSGLVNYLKKTFNWDWIDQDKLIFNYKENFIDIRNPLEPTQIIRFQINHSKKEANLMVDGVEIDKFVIVRTKLFFIICKRAGKKKNDLYLEHINIKCDKHKQIFLTNLRNQANSNSQLYEILSKDANFINALNDRGLSLIASENIIT